jgi:Protein of unknown function (DUF2786)
MEDRIREKIANLVRLAERPGTPAEGEAARLAAIRLSQKHGIPCKFTVGVKKPASARPTASAPPPEPAHEPQSLDTIFYRWIRALANIGWLITETVDTKVGRQIRFRKVGFNSEIRITQRKYGDGNDFEVEHIMRPDPDKFGQDVSYCSYMTTNLNELLSHISMNSQQPFTRREWEYSRK